MSTKSDGFAGGLGRGNDGGFARRCLGWGLKRWIAGSGEGGGMAAAAVSGVGSSDGWPRRRVGPAVSALGRGWRRPFFLYVFLLLFLAGVVELTMLQDGF